MPKNPARELPRFYAPDLDPAAADARLPQDEAHHLTRVLRLGVGDEVGVFDGRGVEFRGRIASLRGADVRVSLLERVERETVGGPPFTLVQAVLKGAAMDEVVRDATMMGAAAIHPLATAFTDVKGDLLARPQLRDRWQRIAIASAKQCRRAALPAIAPVTGLAEWVASPSDAVRYLFVEPSAAAAEPALTAIRRESKTRPAALVVGPEGGWSPGELEAARAHGLRAVRLGPLTLRAVAVPLAAMTLYVCAADAREGGNAPGA